MSQVVHCELLAGGRYTLGSEIAVRTAAMTKSSAYILLVFVALGAAACDKESGEPESQTHELTVEYPNVDEELWPYFQAFEEAAAERDIEVNLGSMVLSASISELEPDGTAGVCHFDSEAPERVIVDRETWDAVSETLREYIVFHELGHCVRYRGHLEDTDDFGRCVSIMASGVEGCRPNYNANTREAHLDELFDEQYYRTWP